MCLALEEDVIAEDDTVTEGPIKQDTSILVNSKTANNDNPADIRSLLSTIYKETPKSKTKINKTSASEK